jgi:AraC family transcriptional regulator
MIEPQLKQLNEMTVAFLSMHGPYDQIPRALAELYEFIAERNYMPLGMPQAVYFTSPAETAPSDAVWEVRVPVAEEAPEGEPENMQLDLKLVPAMLVASAVHKGPYEAIEPAYRALGEWVAQSGYQMAGPPIEIYFSDPMEVPPEEYITEIQFPVVKA